MVDAKELPPFTARMQDVADALRTDISKSRALDLRYMQIRRSQEAWEAAKTAVAIENIKQPWRALTDLENLRQENWVAYTQAYVPESYTINYYIYASEQSPQPQALIEAFSRSSSEILPSGESSKKRPVISSDNPLLPVNANMQRAVSGSLAAISSQMYGRFRFVQVEDPMKADLQFGAVPKLEEDMSGLAIMGMGAILFSAERFSGNYSTVMSVVGLHEIGHGLGLEHPHSYEKSTSGKHIENASFLQSVMTYDKKNAQSASDLKPEIYGFPVGLMPADIQALIALYPITSDAKDGPYADRVAGMNANSTVPVSIQGNDGVRRPLYFPANGVVLQPQRDTTLDRLEIHPGALKGIDHAVPILLRQTAVGMIVTQPEFQGSVLLPAQIEHILLNSQRAHVVETTGNVRVEIPLLEQLPGNKIYASISGKGNEFHVSMVTMQRFQMLAAVEEGAEVTFHVRDSASADLSRLQNLQTDTIGLKFQRNDLKPEMFEGAYRRDGSAHHLKVHDKVTGKEQRITFRLDSDDPIMHAALQAGLLEPLKIYIPDAKPISVPMIDHANRPAISHAALRDAGLPLAQMPATARGAKPGIER